MMEVTREMMARAADLAERFYLADFGGNDAAALRNGICGDSAIRDFVLQVDALTATTRAELVAKDAEIARLREALAAAAKKMEAAEERMRKFARANIGVIGGACPKYGAQELQQGAKSARAALTEQPK